MAWSYGTFRADGGVSLSLGGITCRLTRSASQLTRRSSSTANRIVLRRLTPPGCRVRQHEAANKASRTPDKSTYKADDAKED